MKSTSGRTYHSPRRQAQARATRAAIVGAAGRLFAERGYARTTMQAIAAEAGVAVESVYALAGKAKLLKLAYDRMVVGDDEPIALADRPAFRELLDAPDQRTLIRKMAELGPVIERRLVRLNRVFVQAATSDDWLAEQWRELEEARRTDIGILVRAIAERGPLRDGLTVQSAAELLQATLNWYTYWLLCEQQGLTDGQLADWIEDVLTTLLLPPAG